MEAQQVLSSADVVKIAVSIKSAGRFLSLKQVELVIDILVHISGFPSLILQLIDYFYSEQAFY